MTKVNSLDPPKLATWLLEQFTPVPQNAALAGGLMEVFRQGRSSAWYWKQVLWAILVDFLHSLWKHWGRLAYAIVCSGFISTAWFFMFAVTGRSSAHAVAVVHGGLISIARFYMFPVSGRSSALPAVFDLYAKSYGIQWPWSLVYQIAFLTAFQTVIVTSALVVYRAFSRILTPGKLLRAPIVIVPVLASGNVASTFLGVILSVSRLRLVVGSVLASTPTIIALLIGMWMADRGSRARPVSA